MSIYNKLTSKRIGASVAQILLTVFCFIGFVPGLFLMNQVLPIAAVKDRLEPQSDDPKALEKELDLKCMNLISKHCSKAVGFEAKLQCLNQNPTVGATLGCTIAMGATLKVTLDADTNIDGRVWPAGTVLHKKDGGKIYFAQLINNWTFHGVKCKKGSVWIDEKQMTCTLAENQTIAGIKFKSDGDKLMTVMQSPATISFLIPSGVPVRGVLLENQVIKGIPLMADVLSGFNENGEPRDGVAAEDFTYGRFHKKKGESFLFSEDPSSPFFPGTYDCLTEMKVFAISETQLKNLCAALPVGEPFEKMRNCLPGEVGRRGQPISWDGVRRLPATTIKPIIDKCANFDISFPQRH